MMYGRGYNEINNCFGFGRDHMHGGVGMILMGVFVVALVAIIVFAVRRHGVHRPSNQAVEELKMRFAKGEITEEEYITRKKILD